MGNTVVKVEGLRKRYRLGVIGGATLGDELKVLVARLRGRPNPLVPLDQVENDQRVGQDFWALNGVSFEVEQGQILGIIGRNGAGKSTLLKLLSRITTPTEGRIRMKGRVSSLLEVGTGFHQELTGRENIYLNGAILGMNKAEIDGKLDEIIAFSGIRHHIDTPVKRYSSGMKVRLGFAVAAHLEPEIMIIDEVLAVGDADFQRKCLGKMKDVASSGRTVLFVSHNMLSVRSLCTRVIWLQDGRVEMDGPTDEVVQRYLSIYADLSDTVEWTAADAPRADGVLLRRVALRRPAGQDVLGITSPFSIEIDLENVELADGDLNVGIHVYNGDDVLAFASTLNESLTERAHLAIGRHRIRCAIPGELLNSGEYRVVVNVFRRNKLHLQQSETISFEIHDVDRSGSWFGRRKGVFRPRLEWGADLLEQE